MNERRKTQLEQIPPGLGSMPQAAANSLPPGLTGAPAQNTDEFRPSAPAADPASAEPILLGESDEVVDCLEFCPVDRPPTALLCILDDRSRDDGEWVRIRLPKLVIGRSEGDLVLPHDAALSARHAEIGRQPDGRNHRWYLQDLQSTNGTFVRAAQVVLKPSQQFMIGRSLLSYDPPGQSAVNLEDPADQGTRDWRSAAPAELQRMVPALVDLSPQGSGTRHLLTQNEMLLGSDPQQCQLVIRNDPFVSPVHVSVQQSSPGRWTLKNLKSRNGLWVRVEKIWLDSLCEFQIGEQRCLFKLP